MSLLYKILSLLGDAKALSRGPGPFARRYARRAGHRTLARTFRKAGL